MATEEDEIVTPGAAALLEEEAEENDPLRCSLNFPPFVELCVDTEVDLRYYKQSGLVFRPRRHWCFIGEIFNDDLAQIPFLRNRVFVKDIKGTELAVSFYPESFLDKLLLGSVVKDLKKGHTLCKRYAESHFFLDFTVGLRIENLDTLKIIKTTLANLLEISSINPLKKQKCCWVCLKSEDSSKLFRCSRCKYAKYCGQACQRGDWKTHKRHCEFIPDFIALTDINYGEFTDYIPFNRLPSGW